ncbi:MAG: scrK 3 [Frankiales bacterium]|nr:scrK 3 [Frankiales bacterium]
MICVIGEALIDLVEQPRPPHAADATSDYRAHPGGSPFNVAIGLARLGQHSVLQARLSGDAFGRQLRRHAEANGVDLSVAVEASEPTTLAIVGLDAAGNASYDFYLEATADWQWTAPELAAAPAEASWVHTGSLASWTNPGADTIHAHLRSLRETGRACLSYDPNIRPLLMPDHGAALQRIEASVGLAHVVKASAEDLGWLYPDQSFTEVLDRWQTLGPALVVVTDGARGAHARTGDGQQFEVRARSVPVVDTVGAGDAFMAGLINALSRIDGFQRVAQGNGLGHISRQAVADALDEAALVSALTVSQAGANPPSAATLAAARG